MNSSFVTVLNSGWLLTDAIMRWYHSQIQPYGFEDLAELICLLGAVPNKKIVSEEEDFAVAVRAFTRDTLLSDQVWKRRLNAPRFRIRVSKN